MSNDPLLPAPLDSSLPIDPVYALAETTRALDPWKAFGVLIVDKTVGGLNGTIYTFQRSRKTANERGHRDGAMITVKRDAKSFKLSYYPLSGENQIVKELGVETLPQVVSDLLLAGFPYRIPSPPPASYKPAPLRIEEKLTQVNVDAVEIVEVSALSDFRKQLHYPVPESDIGRVS